MINISAARKARRKPVELNMAPLIDMVFILLIFFLVTTRFVSDTGIEIQRPSARTASVLNAPDIRISVTRDEQIVLDTETIDLLQLTNRVEGMLLEHPRMRVLIIADAGSSTGFLTRVMDACRKGGADRIALAADPDTKQER